MTTTTLTMAQALTKWMAAQSIRQLDGSVASAFAGVWAIFGHGNVAGLGEALYGQRDSLPTFRGHNEQGMAHVAIAYAKQMNRRRFMAVTSSIGPGATNMVTAAALAHVNRLPVLLLPGDVFADRRPDPVLQQVEDFADGTVSANDCFRPVSRYFDRITRPEQILQSLPKAMSVLTDPAQCGPVTLSLCQDVQAESYAFPDRFFASRIWEMRRQRPDEAEMAKAIAVIREAKRPLILAGGGVRYSGASAALTAFAESSGIPVAATQAGKSVMPEAHPNYVGSLGVTGSSAANELAQRADVVLSVGSRLQDFTTGSNGLIKGQVLALNVQLHDAIKHDAMTVVGDALVGVEALGYALAGHRTSAAYQQEFATLKGEWDSAVDAVVKKPDGNALPSDSAVIGAVNRNVPSPTIAVGAAGSMPGELHKLWRAGSVDGYHMEYGFSCMGYEVSAGIGVYMASPDRPNVVFAGDGSYLMMNSELATAVMMGISMTLIITDNRGYGCINRLQAATGGAPFNNLLADAYHEILPEIDYAAHAASLGARSQKVSSLDELEEAVQMASGRTGVDVIVIDTDPGPSTEAGGVWWDVAVPAISDRGSVNSAYENYVQGRKRQEKGDK
ncbi:MAG: 3D-(3,5/4)-trihydroxycyclohexane-1,2-dione acylhydrolase (decyclizing) [SAR116 cluster bacterium]|nr:MAG: 3D-(3,5/4)-trihydroxycyclohexane-1,2-dione acylhydrolase (decyclizing) [SAR116 cluster bacterium]